MSADAIAVGVFSIVGTLLGGALGLYGERWLRRQGEVRCWIREGDWYAQQRGEHAEERRLRLTFLNEKEVTVAVLDMWISFRKGGKLLEEWARPRRELVDDDERRSPLAPFALPARIPVTLTISFLPEKGDAEKIRELLAVDQAEFIAVILGAKPIKRKLTPPW